MGVPLLRSGNYLNRPAQHLALKVGIGIWQFQGLNLTVSWTRNFDYHQTSGEGLNVAVSTISDLHSGQYHGY